MDIGLSARERNNNYFYAMAKIDADKLITIRKTYLDDNSEYEKK
ncbi:hypothetical protein [Yersinia mollaretii]|nr:hypothetical protein [Yersinia mollaretii]MDN0111028.1 hypothetical protein [Yersinia mollaretii]